jgi:uncharacterized membrane protein YphA (DoxX/SURF4 family)
MKRKITFVVSLLFGLMFINAGLNKFFNYMPVPEKMPERLTKAMGAIMEIGWLLPLIGFAETLGGILIIFPRTRALGALIICPVMAGILLTNTVTDTGGLPIALIFAAILLWIIYDNRARYLPLIAKEPNQQNLSKDQPG